MNIDGLRGARPPVGRKKPVDEGLKPCGLFENHARAFPVLVAHEFGLQELRRPADAAQGILDFVPEVAEEFAVRRPHARFHGASFRLERVLEFRDFKDACSVGRQPRRADVLRREGGENGADADGIGQSAAKFREGRIGNHPRSLGKGEPGSGLLDEFRCGLPLKPSSRASEKGFGRRIHGRDPPDAVKRKDGRGKRVKERSRIERAFLKLMRNLCRHACRREKMVLSAMPRPRAGTPEKQTGER